MTSRHRLSMKGLGVVGLLVVVFLSVLTLPGSTTAATSGLGDYPSRPITLLIGFPPGGGSDGVARPLIAVGQDYFNTRIIPEYIPGASGAIAAERLSRSEPDGYTLLLGLPHHITVMPHVEDLGYDPLALRPIALLNMQDSIAITPADRPWSTWEELVAYARANPGKVSYASVGPWSGNHIRYEAIAQELGLDLLHVPFGGGADMTQAVVRGEVDFAISGANHAKPALDSGRVKPLAIVSSTGRRLPYLPDVPTLKELGIQVELLTWYGIFAPPGTPDEIVQFIEQKLEQTVKDPVYIDLVTRLGETPTFMGSAQFTAYIHNEYRTVQRVIEAVRAGMD